MIKGSVVVGLLDNGTWSACFGMSYRDLMFHDLTNKQRFFKNKAAELRKICGTMGVANGRNEIARAFLDHTEGEWLFFIDSDMGFAPDTVDRLIESANPKNRPVVGGLCFALQRVGTRDHYSIVNGIQPTVFKFHDLGTEVGFAPILDYPRDSLVEVSGTGAACLLIHRSALEKIRDKYGDSWFDPITHPTGNSGKPRTFSEDLSFCLRLAAVDLPVYVNTAVKTTHEKGALYLDEPTYDRLKPTLPR